MEKKKTKEQEIIENIDKAITELVYEKTAIVKAYNYYHGKRDEAQFKHLEENYGIGCATSVEFVPLIRKHIDVLVGEYLSTPPLLRVSCKDKQTISNIASQRSTKINDAVASELKKVLIKIINGEQIAVNKIDSDLEELVKTMDANFISDYEIAAQDIVSYMMQSRDIDFVNKRKVILLHLLISGMCYYKVVASPGNTNARLVVLNPLNTFIERNPESVYLKHSARSVVRTFMTKHQILTNYGHILKSDDLKTLDNNETLAGESHSYLTTLDKVIEVNGESDGILGGFEIAPTFSGGNTSFRTYPVYEVEWLQADKEDGKYVTNRYEGIRIGSEIYIPIGKSSNVVRSIDSPNECSLSVNGIFYSDINGDPFSLVLATASLQDKFDCLSFYRDNIIAESGSVGDWVDMAHLPKFLGATDTERLMKFKAYKKQGIALYDSSQEGDVINTSFVGYDDTIKLQAIQAIDLAMQRIEETASTITGVFRERLGGIEQKDAVTNVQVGVTQSSLITKQYFQLMDLMTREILVDLLDICKIVYKNGISGVLVLGENLNRTFTALPQYYSITDFDIHIIDTSEYKLEQETIKSLRDEFTKQGIVDPEVIVEMVTSKGLTKMKADVLGAIAKKKKEANQLGQLEQQLNQATEQLKQISNEAQKLQSQVQQLNSEKIALEKERLQFNKELEWYKAKSKTEYDESMIELEKKRIQLEGAQLLDLNIKNDEVKNS